MESWGSPSEAEAGRSSLRKRAEMKRSEMCDDHSREREEQVQRS